jgi:uncharacterized membrane protein
MPDDAYELLAGIVAVGTFPAAVLAATLFGAHVGAFVGLVGWAFLLPVLGMLSEYLADEQADDASSSVERETEADDALDRLRERYAAGEIGEAEFERRLERLLETEDAEMPDGAPADHSPSDREREREVAFDDR